MKGSSAHRVSFCLIVQALALLILMATGGTMLAHASPSVPVLQSGGPAFGPLTILTPPPIGRYERFEVSFPLTSTSATNPYFPYDAAPPAGVVAATGISIDMLLLPPDTGSWEQALVQPCFYYQPVDPAVLLPEGKPTWRCRFAPDVVGLWQYRLRATDAAGTVETAPAQFETTSSNRKGFVQVGEDDSRFFTFADGTSFFYPLVNAEAGNPFNGLERIRQNIPRLGENAIRFIRWFPTEEGANFYIIPFAGDIVTSWGFGREFGARIVVDDSDPAGGHFTFVPYQHSNQTVHSAPPGTYRLTVRALVTNNKTLEVGLAPLASRQIPSASGWRTHTFTADLATARALTVRLSGDGTSDVRVAQVQLQRLASGGEWGPDLLTRGDPDTYRYVDQVAAARLDALLALSEQVGVYHKLALFHKLDAVLNRLHPDGTAGAPGTKGSYFYAGPEQQSRWYQQAYVRYFLARWSYSPSLHSVELVNESFHVNDVPNSYEAGHALARFVHDPALPRYLLVSNSFWGLWGPGDAAMNFNNFWSEPEIDYADKHWYANDHPDCFGACVPGPNEEEMLSKRWDDSAAYVRQCTLRFGEYRTLFDYQKPLVRGEGGVAEGTWAGATGPQHACLQNSEVCPGDEHRITYYHKKVWANLGAVGATCDGEWYSQLYGETAPADLLAIYEAYERFMAGEATASGGFRAIGSDLAGTEQVDVPPGVRAWGVQDRTAGRTLLWIDNSDDTWWHVANGELITPRTGTVRVPGFVRSAVYKVTWWDTILGQPTVEQNMVADANGMLSLAVTALTGDVAVKVGRHEQPVTDTYDLHLPVILETVASRLVHLLRSPVVPAPFPRPLPPAASPPPAPCPRANRPCP